MKNERIIQNARDGRYWLGLPKDNNGLYPNDNWTTDITKAQLFKDEREIDIFLKSNFGIFEGMFLVCINVWSLV